MVDIAKLERINRKYSEPFIPFLQEQTLDFAARKPLKGVRILHNCINTYETLLKIEPLLKAGAELTMTRCDLVATSHQQEVDAIIEDCGICHIPNYADLKGEFDIGMDCAGRFLDMPRVYITKGIVELTQSGTVLYKNANLPIPIISVDDSYLKNLECMHGTAEAFIRAFEQLTQEKIGQQTYLLFGYGKIGQGIAKILAKKGAAVFVVDTNPLALDLAKQRGLNTISSQNKTEIQKIAGNAFAIICATGSTGVLSKYLRPTDITDAYIANMGVDNEIGEALSSYPKLLANGGPINFQLHQPTLMRYLDPIFYAHNAVIEAFLKSPKLKNGYHRFDETVDRHIVNRWVDYHNENVDDIWL